MSSTAVLEATWRFCNRANATPNQGFVMEQVGKIGYVGFPSMGNMDSYSQSGVLTCVEDSENNQMFSPLQRQINEGEKPIMVEAAFLHLFLSIYPTFRTQVSN